MLVVGDFERIRVAGSLAVLSTWKEPPTVIIKKKREEGGQHVCVSLVQIHTGLIDASPFFSFTGAKLF